MEVLHGFMLQCIPLHSKSKFYFKKPEVDKQIVFFLVFVLVYFIILQVCFNCCILIWIFLPLCLCGGRLWLQS